MAHSPLSHVVIARDLRKTYGAQQVVDGITFSVARGECFGILGPNGAGKTTTLRMLIGNLPPSSGDLQVLGLPVPAQARAMRTRLGVVAQQDNLDPDFTVAENLELYGNFFGLNKRLLRERIPGLLEFAALSYKANAPITTLSGGMQRRLSLARALVNQPELLVLDEPTTGLDPQARQLIWQRLRQLKKQGLSLILTTHYMEEAERLCDRLIVLDHGRILEQGSPRELVARHIEAQVVELHGPRAAEWGTDLAARREHVGDTWFYYGNDLREVLQRIEQTRNDWPDLRYLHRPANLEDVFLKLTGRDLRED